MTFGIIGAGRVGQAFARQLVKAGYEVVLSNSHGRASLSSLVSDLGPCARAGTVAEAARAQIVMIAVRWTQLHEALAGLPPWDGRIVIAAMNLFLRFEPDFQVADLGGRTSSDVVAELAPTLP
jgi:8-hydroxy-5-deazaflavin:NADPH oxidoreductase